MLQVSRPTPSHFGIYVTDLERMVAFYTEVFDLTVTDWGEGRTFKNTLVFTSAGPGDVTWAYQWNFTIAANSEQDILKDKLLSIDPVPEPSTMATCLILALVFRRLRLQRG